MATVVFTETEPPEFITVFYMTCGHLDRILTFAPVSIENKITQWECPDCRQFMDILFYVTFVTIIDGWWGARPNV